MQIRRDYPAKDRPLPYINTKMAKMAKTFLFPFPTPVGMETPLHTHPLA